MSDYYYCPKCDKAILKARALKKDKIVKKNNTPYCTGKLSSSKHDPVKLMIEEGPPTYRVTISWKFFLISILISTFTAFITYTSVKPIDLTMITFAASMMLLTPLNARYFGRKKIHDKIRRKALSNTKKEKIREIYGLDWKDNLYGGIEFFIALGIFVFFFTAAPYILMLKNDYSKEVTTVFRFFILSGFLFTAAFLYLYLKSSSITKLVPTSEKDTRELIRNVLKRNDIPYKVKIVYYSKLGNSKERKSVKKYVSDKIDLEIETLNDHKGRYIEINYNRLKNWMHKRVRGLDLIEAIKDSIDTYVEYYR